MENKSCKNCGRFYINNQACYQKCGEDFTLWKPIPTPNKMIEVWGIGTIGQSLGLQTSIKIDPETNTAIQSYLAQEIEKRKLIPITDAVKYVEIDIDKVDKIINDYSDHLLINIPHQHIVYIIGTIKKLNPLKLKQQGEAKNDIRKTI